MKLSLCTITFRHQLVSIDRIAKWASANYFDAIELWGIHALNLAEWPDYNAAWLAQQGLRISMLSDYLPLAGPEAPLTFKVHQLCRLAKHWQTTKIRTFAGSVGSRQMTKSDFRQLVTRLQTACGILATYGLNLVIETHPHTYADSLESIDALFQAVAQPNLQLNFDVLHVWESGVKIGDALDQLAPLIQHFHFKNVTEADRLTVFAPDNVYAASGSREGMVPLFEGMLDYGDIIGKIIDHPSSHLSRLDASLEWFGNQCHQVLSKDRYLIQQHCQQQAISA